MKKKPLISLVMGSDSDLPILEETTKVLKTFNIPYELTITSAHRSPKKTIKYAQEATKRGIEVIIAGAGGAAHLAGVIAAHTLVPVLGVPIDSSPLKGLDSLLSTVQMPGGVPVAAMAIGKAGAKNAGIFAAQILALKHPEIKKALEDYRSHMTREVETKDKALKKSSIMLKAER
jgi:phosphoribosylaminoimidazole carboxylase PurE protein